MIDESAARDAIAASDAAVADPAWTADNFMKWFTPADAAAIEALDGEQPDPWAHSTPIGEVWP